MTEPHANRDAAPELVRPSGYPTNHVLAIMDTPEQVRSAAIALRNAGFVDSELTAMAGPTSADELHEMTGRTGLTNLLIRIAERIGAADDEMRMKDRYEQALREGKFIVGALSPTEERKTLAARILEEHGAQSVNFLGRFAIESIRR